MNKNKKEKTKEKTIVITEEDKVKAKLVSENTKRVVYTSMILVICLPLLFLIYLLFPVGEEIRLIFDGVFITFEIASLVYFILSTIVIQHKKIELSMFVIYTFWGFVEFFGMMLSFILYYEQRDLTVYYMTVTAITIIALLKTEQMLIYVGIELICSIVMIIVLQMEPYNIVGVAMINGMMIVLSRMLFETQVSSHTMKQKVKRMEKVSEEDPLTKMLNRRGLEHQLKVLWGAAVRNKHIVGIIMMDIDNFKKYNDTFGHPQGDKCLQSVAEAIKRSASRSSDIAARVGGEEFMVFISEANSDLEPIRLADKIRKSVESMKIPHSPLVANPYVTISVGVEYMVPTENDTFEALYDAADKALYYAKHNGRNCIVCGNRIYSAKNDAAPSEKKDH